MQRSFVVIPASAGTAARRGKQLAPIQTNFTKDAYTQTQQPSQAGTNARDSASLHAESVRINRRQSRKILGLFDRSKSQKENSIVKDDLENVKLTSNRRASQTDIKKSNHLQKRRPSKKEAEAKPPTFVQALSRAAKRITLAVPVTNADDLLRIRKRQESSMLDEDDGQYADDNTSDLRGAVPAFLPTNWTACIFILTTGGLLLQYSAIGLPDRLPERFIQLTGDSAAFTSDAVAGRRWVVQVTQSTSEHTNSGSARSRLSRIGSRSGKSSKNSMLLVLETAKQMESWLVALKLEITARASKTSSPEPAPSIISRASGSVEQETSYHAAASQRFRDASSQFKTQSKTSLDMHNGQREFLQLAQTDSATSPGSSPVEDTRGILRGPYGLDRPADLSPVKEELMQHPLLQWELPANFSPTITGFLTSLLDIDTPPDCHPALRQHSPSIVSDGAPNFSVPSFSHRFSNSTKSGTLIATPTRSSVSSFSAPSSIDMQKGAKEIHSIMSFPPIVTSLGSQKVSQQSITCCRVYDEDWSEPEEATIISFDEETVPSRRSFSLPLSDSENEDIPIIPTEVLLPEPVAPQQWFSSSSGRHMTKENPLGISCLDQTSSRPSNQLPSTVDSFPLPPRTRKVSAPAALLSPVNKSEQKAPRSRSPRPPVYGLWPHKKSSSATLHSIERGKPLTLRERRSFTTIPRHLLGPPLAPPPTDPLPAIPTIAVAAAA